MTHNTRSANILLDAVDQLTIGQRITVRQEFDDGVRATKVLIPGFIGLLRESISSSTTGTGGGSLPNQRNMLDSDAAEKYDRIVSDILEAFKSVTSAKPFESPEQNLRQWFISVSNSFRAGKLSDDAMFDLTQKWVDWARIIEDKLFPPTTLEVISPCPSCNHRWAKNGDGDSIAAIVIEYRKPSSDRVNALSKSHAKCRNCEKVWRGDRKLRELAFFIEQMQISDGLGLATRHAQANDFNDVETIEPVTLISAGNSCAQNNEIGAS